MIVVADTTPVNYLILIGAVDALGRLYERVLIPQSVYEELTHARTPAAVGEWVQHLPGWLIVQRPTRTPDASLHRLAAGERDAILLAEEFNGEQLIIDELLGRRIAEQRGIPVLGTVGVLREAAEAGLLDLSEAFERLQQTSFHISPAILSEVLRNHRK
jgi:predicted nucleic acid-binding protein